MRVLSFWLLMMKSLEAGVFPPPLCRSQLQVASQIIWAQDCLELLSFTNLYWKLFLFVKWAFLLRVSPQTWPSQPRSLSPWSAHPRQPWADMEKLFLGMTPMMSLWLKRKVKGECSWPLFGYCPCSIFRQNVVSGFYLFPLLTCLMEQFVFSGSTLRAIPHLHYKL